MQLIESDVLNWDKKRKVDFPGGPVVKNLPANAGDMGSIPGLGRFHMPRGQLNLCTTTTQPAHLEPKLPNEKPPQ